MEYESLTPGLNHIMASVEELPEPVNYSPAVDHERPMRQTGGPNPTPPEDSAPEPL